MRRKLGVKQLGVIFLAVCSLSGCKETTAAATEETTAEVSVETAETSEETEESLSESKAESSDVDRYAEIMDTSNDSGKLTVYFLDLEVGEEAEDKAGDSAILISPDGKVMLLDAGHPEAGHLVVDALKDLGVEKIDYLVASHPHIDHIGGIPEVMDAFPVGETYRSYVEYTTKTYQNYVEKIDYLVASHPHIDHIGGIPEVMDAFPVGETYRSYVEYTTKTYQNYVNALENSEAETHFVKTGDVFQFGDEVSVEVLGPDEEIQYPKDFPDNSTEFLNDHSLTLKFTYGETSALFCGDLYRSQERDYVEQYGEKLDVDLIKANHHGKDTSNSKKWIEAASPQAVVAMNDKAPNMTVVENYQKEGAEFHHTLLDGVVKVTMDDKQNVEIVDQKDSWLN